MLAMPVLCIYLQPPCSSPRSTSNHPPSGPPKLAYCSPSQKSGILSTYAPSPTTPPPFPMQCSATLCFHTENALPVSSDVQKERHALEWSIAVASIVCGQHLAVYSIRTYVYIYVVHQMGSAHQPRRCISHRMRRMRLIHIYSIFCAPKNTQNPPLPTRNRKLDLVRAEERIDVKKCVNGCVLVCVC